MTEPRPFIVLSVNGVEPTACGCAAPLSVYTATPSAEAAALRTILETGIAGQSFPPKHDWVELERGEDLVTYGQRTGPVGIGSVVSVRREDGTWTFGGSGGCGPLRYGPARAAYLDMWTEEGGDLVLHWTGGYGLDNASAVRVQETPTEVRVVVVPEPEPPLRPGEFRTGAATGATSRVTLADPVGARRVVNVGYVPGQDVQSLPEYEAPQDVERQPEHERHRRHGRR